MPRKILLLCHGANHDLAMAGFLTIADIRSGPVLTMDVDAATAPDFVHDFTAPFPNAMKAHLGTFDLVYPVACPAWRVFSDKDSLITRQAIANVEALLKPGGMLYFQTTMPWYLRVNKIELFGMPQDTFDQIEADFNEESNDYDHKGVPSALRKALAGSKLRVLPKSAAKKHAFMGKTRIVVQKSR